MTQSPITVYQAGYSFDITRIPRNVAEAKAHVMAEFAKIFDMALECGAEEVLELTVVRQISEHDTFGDKIILALRVTGEDMKTTVRPVGEVQKLFCLSPQPDKH